MSKQQPDKRQQTHRSAKPTKQPYPETIASFLAGMPKPLPKLQVKPVTVRKMNPVPPLKPKPLPVLVSKPMQVLVPIRPMRALAPISPKPPIAPTPISVAPILNHSAITPCSKPVPMINIKPVAGPAELRITAERKTGHTLRLAGNPSNRRTPHELGIVDRGAEVIQ